jgi:hypothetical protein
MSANCPFCGSRPKRPLRYDYDDSNPTYWICGTSIDSLDENGEELYSTGRECDMTCFRNCVIRQADLLRRVIECGGSPIPNVLFNAIKAEIREIPPT